MSALSLQSRPRVACTLIASAALFQNLEAEHSPFGHPEGALLLAFRGLR